MRYSILRAMAASTRRVLSLAIPAVLALVAAPAFAAPCSGFTDVESTDGFCANVAWLKNRSITLGCTSTTLYCPAATVNRLQMAAFMNRLGTALTPVVLRNEDALASLDLDANPVVCQTDDFAAENFPRTAYADASFGATAAADVGLAARLVMSVDGGTSWSDLNVSSSRGFVAAGQWGTLTDLGFALLESEQSARWGLRVSRDGAGADLGASRCHVRVRVFGRDDPPPANAAPTVNAGPDQTITLPASASLAATVNDDGRPNPPAALALAWSKLSGPGTVTFGNANAAQTTVGFSVDGVYVLRLTANDGALSASDDVQVTVQPEGALPPPPETVASQPAPGVVGDLAEDTRFLYTGSNPIQTGVSPGAIDRLRAAVLRGRVITRGGSALSGVTINVLDHPSLGQTLSRVDGRFDLAANGGGVVTLNYVKAGFIPVQRQVVAPMRDFIEVEEVVMISLDTAVTTIAANGPALQVHRGNVASDVNGARRPTLLFAAGTTATLVMPNGTTQPITSLDVRTTEYTVGPDGPRSMPGPLPPASGYTYAVELSVDQAMAAGAKTVTFSQPVVHYVENFLGFPVGGAVPTGFYDRTKAAWIPSSNGRVIKITAISGGIATVDTVGSGSLAPLTLGSVERQQLASLYTVGQELWRVPIPHFSPWDCNWPYGPPDGAEAPDLPPPVDDDQIDDPTCSAGSIIECENQTLGERVAIVGTPFALNYRSSRVPGRIASRALRIPLSGASVPAGVKRIELEVQVAGRSFRQAFGTGANQHASFAWDGLDAYGRAVQGAQPATVRVSYAYDAVYRSPDTLLFAFGAFGGGGIASNRARSEILLSQTFKPMIGAFDARSIGLGGWTLSSHHVYDPAKRLLYQGDGARRSAKGVGTAFEQPTRQLVPPTGLATGPDGSIYISGRFNFFDMDEVVRMSPDGTLTWLADDSDGPPLISVVTPQGLAVGLDGSVYVAEKFAHRIRRIRPDGTITLVAGTGIDGFSGDGGAATQARLSLPHGIAIAADGTIYFADSGNERLRRIRPDGVINTVAGGIAPFCNSGPCGDDGPAKQASLSVPAGVALGPDGALFLTESNVPRVRRIGTDGIITRVAGTGTLGYSGDGGPATEARLRFPSDVKVAADGSVYIADTFNGSVRRVSPDGIISTVAGTGVRAAAGPPAHGQAPTSVTLGRIEGIALTLDGTLYIADEERSQFLRLASPMSGVSLGDIAVPSVDGRVLHQFDSRGRHLRTLHALTGATLLTFDYDAAGRLTSVVEKTGGTDNVTTIERDAAGKPTVIVAPFGQRTLLGVDANGFLSSITNPAGEAIGLQSTSSGLLTTLTDPRGKSSTFAYDVDGRLVRDADAADGIQTLARSELPTGFTASRSTALGRTTSYLIETGPEGIRKRTITAPDATQMLIDEDFDAGTRKVAMPDATLSTLERGADPRFGMQAPIAKSLIITAPGGPTLTASSTQTAELSDDTDVLSLISLTRTATMDDRTTTSMYTASTRTAVVTTPAGRTTTVASDVLGRAVQTQSGGLAPSAFTYDARGRVGTVTRGTGADARTFVFAYDPQGFLQSITDPSGRSVQFDNDAAGRVISKTLPDGRVLGFGYDAAGNLTSLTPPGRPAHTFGYSDRSDLMVATPPAVAGTGATSMSYNADGQHVTTTRPDNRTVTFGYDSAGRLSTRALATGGVTTGTDTVSYDTAGRVATVAAASGITTSYAYAGSLLTGESWAGSTAGSVTRSYDNSFRLTSQSVNGANTIAFGYDGDSLLIGAGSLAITRDALHGLATGSTLGVVATSTSYNSFGETSGFAATAGATSLYSVSYVRDVIGRIRQKTETVGGVSDTYVYTYDAAGQLTLVTKNGAVVESYGYDSNGNRTAATVGGVSVTASYDAQDRLASYGTSTFAYTAAGELSSRTAGGQTTTYQYDAVGNLLSANLPGGTAITYIADGRGRRVGKRVNGAPVQRFLYSDALRPVAEIDGTGVLVSRFVYAGRHAPAYVIKGGVAHRIITDHLGSVRLVVNASTGTIAQRIDYDTFGNVIADTSPGFQPFGFAGGLYDASTGLVRFGARDYDPRVGRWTAKDPIGFAGRDSNLYRYVRNNPVNLVDPLGMGVQTDLESLISWLEATIADLKGNPTPSGGTGLAPWNETEVSEYGRAKAERSGLRAAYEKELTEARGKLTSVKVSNRTPLSCGGLASVASAAAGLLDFIVVAQRSQDSGRSFFEELGVQAADIKEAQVNAGTHTTVNFLGPILFVEGGAPSAGPSLNDFGSL